MANKADMLKLLNYLAAQGLQFGPARDLFNQTADGWVDVLGHLDVGVLQIAVRAYLGGSDGRTWPQPVAIREEADAYQRMGPHRERPRSNCVDCGGSGVAQVTVICRAERGDSRIWLMPEYLPARCRCGAGDHAPNFPETNALLDYLHSPRALERRPGLVDVVELPKPWGNTYARGLEQVWSGGPVQSQHRHHAWAVVEEARRPQGPKEALRGYATRGSGAMEAA